LEDGVRCENDNSEAEFEAENTNEDNEAKAEMRNATEETTISKDLQREDEQIYEDSSDASNNHKNALLREMEKQSEEEMENSTLLTFFSGFLSTPFSPPKRWSSGLGASTWDLNLMSTLTFPP